MEEIAAALTVTATSDCDLLHWLLPENPFVSFDTGPSFDTVMIGGGSVPYRIRLNTNSTFKDYVDKFCSFIQAQLANCVRLDVIFDCYSEESLKGVIRDITGTGMRRHVMEKVRVPSNFAGFLSDSNGRKN